MAIIFIIAVIYAAVANIYVWPFQWYRFGLDALLMSTWGGIIMNKLNDLEDIKKKKRLNSLRWKYLTCGAESRNWRRRNERFD